MPRTIEIARATHLLGIKRSHLQKLIKSGDLQTFEGKIDIDELKACFPSTAILAGVFESELEFIKKAAYSNRVQSAVLPSKEDLNSQLDKTKIKLLVERQKADKYMQVVKGLLDYIAVIRSDASEPDKKVIDKISHWVLHEMNKKP